MTAASPDRRIALLAAPGSLPGLEQKLSERGWTVVRFDAIRTEPARIRSDPRWLCRDPPAAIWVVTSRAVVRTISEAHPDWWEPLHRIPNVVSIGDGTTRALRDAGVQVTITVAGTGSKGVLGAVGRPTGRRVLYLRSDRAGPGLARALRQRGARVIDRVLYRTREAGRLPAAAGRRLGSIPVWVVSSPSAFSGFRRAIGPANYRTFAPRARSFALGPRTARALRRAGLGRVAVPKQSTEEGFTKLLGQVLGDGPPSRSRRGRGSRGTRPPAASPAGQAVAPGAGRGFGDDPGASRPADVRRRPGR